MEAGTRVRGTRESARQQLICDANTSRSQDDDDDDDASSSSFSSSHQSSQSPDDVEQTNITGRNNETTARETSTSIFCRPLTNWLQTERENFRAVRAALGPQLFIYLAIIYFVGRGFAYAAAKVAKQPYLQLVDDVGGQDYQRYSSLITVGFALKPAIGLLSDVFPLFSYHKKYYVLASAVVCFTCATLLVFKPAGEGVVSAVALFFITLGVGCFDLLSEARYSEVIRRLPALGPHITSHVMFIGTLGDMISSCIAGPIVDHGSPRILMAVIAVVFVPVCWPPLRGYLQERRVSYKMRTTRVSRHKGLLYYTAILVTSAIVIVVASLLATRRQRLIVEVACATALLLGSWLLLPGLLGRVCVYMLLHEVTYVQFPILDYFYLAADKCVKNGPRFSFTYYYTAMHVVAAVAMALGIVLYRRLLSRSSFCFAVAVTTLIKAAASVFDIIMVKRWNVTVLGIPDDIFYVFGDAVMGSVARMLALLPTTILTAQLCSRGVEAVVFAALAGTFNFGASLATLVGLNCMEAANVYANKSHGCNFDNLPLLIFIGRVCTPMLSIPLAYMLLPRVALNEKLDVGPRTSRGVVSEEAVGSDGEEEDDAADDGDEGYSPSAGGRSSSIFATTNIN